MANGDLETRLAWQRWIGVSDNAMEHYEAVMARHREPQRHYHDVRHVRWVVRHVLELASTRGVSDTGVVVAAAFFHDVIYDATASNNETASAQLARQVLDDLQWQPALIDRVATLIEGTQHHRATTLDEAVLFAADLSVLASDAAGYADYVRNVRREYHHVSDLDWVVGRQAVLGSFLQRAAIYSPELELTAWEARARANLTAELATLTSS